MIHKLKSTFHKERNVKSSITPTKQPESPQDCHTSTSLLIPQSSFNGPTSHQQVPLYSIKYLGITKGQIGILSKRSPIPYLSPLETCKDVPMTIINSSLSDRKTSSRLINRLINTPNNVQLLTDISLEKNEAPETEENFPNPEQYNEKIIHTYARPKALVSVKKEVTENENTRKPIVMPYNRVGISGWKLSRPKTAEVVPAVRGVRTRSVAKREKKEKPQIEAVDLMDEPYLKYLAEKRKIS